MALAPLKSVNSARKPQGKCSSCQVELPAGSPYRYYRSGYRGPKVKFCMKSECTPRESQRESSKLADVYAAQEDARDSINSAETVEEVRDAVETLSGAVGDTASEYEDAINETPMLEDQLTDKLGALEDYQGSLDGFEPDIDEDMDADDVLRTAKDEALELVDSLEV